MSHLRAADSNYVMEKMDEIRCVPVCMCGWEIRACSYLLYVCAREGTCTWTVPIFANSPIQADINVIDCNWAVMCGI